MMDDDSESTFATWRQEVYGSSKGANKLKENTKFCRTSFLLRMSRHPNGKLNVNSMFERLDGIDDAITEDEFTEFVVKGGGRGHKKCPSQKELRAVFRKISKGVFRLQRGCPLRRPSGVSSVRSRALSTVSWAANDKHVASGDGEVDPEEFMEFIEGTETVQSTGAELGEFTMVGWLGPPIDGDIDGLRIASPRYPPPAGPDAELTLIVQHRHTPPLLAAPDAQQEGTGEGQGEGGPHTGAKRPPLSRPRPQPPGRGLGRRPQPEVSGNRGGVEMVVPCSRVRCRPSERLGVVLQRLIDDAIQLHVAGCALCTANATEQAASSSSSSSSSSSTASGGASGGGALTARLAGAGTHLTSCSACRAREELDFATPAMFSLRWHRSSRSSTELEAARTGAPLPSGSTVMTGPSLTAQSEIVHRWAGHCPRSLACMPTFWGSCCLCDACCV
jgi:hypothetical protein